MFTTRGINTGCNPVEAFSQCQSNTMPVQGRYGYATDVKLPHQMLYGVMPQLKEESQTLIHALSLSSSTRGAYDLALNWQLWQPFIAGVNLHDLHAESALCDLLDLQLSSSNQQLAMYKMKCAVVTTINEQLNKHKYKACNRLIKQGLIARKEMLEFISTTYSYSVKFDTEGESNYGSYDDVGLMICDEKGLAVVDLDFSSVPLPLKHYSHALVHLLANLTCSLWSADLAVAAFGYNDLYDVLLDMTTFEERVALRDLASKAGEDEFKAVLKEQYDALYTEIMNFDEEFDWSYSLLMDLLSFHFDFDFGNDYQALVDPSNLKLSAANLLTELTALGVRSKSISRHPHYNKLKLVTQLLSDNIHAVESSSFNNCSDIYLPETRVISVDISNDNGAINSINEMQCEVGESAAFTVDLTNDNAIKNLENIWLGNAVLAFL